MAKITKRLCADVAGRPVTPSNPWTWDDEVPGFGLRANANGRPSFVVKYRVKGDPTQRLVTMGEFPTTQPDEMRTRASAIKTAARQGVDLIAAERAQAERDAEQRRETTRLAIPMVDLLDAWRGATDAVIVEKEARGESVLYERELLRLERSLLRPAIKNETAGGFDPDRWQALIDVQTSPSTARNLRALIVRLIRFTNTRFVLQGVSVRWPTKFDLSLKGRSREHRFTIEEAAALWIGAGTLGRRGAMVRFMLLTGCRRIEAQKATWQQIHLDDAVLGAHWQQPSAMTKTKVAHRVPLAPPAVALLRWLPPRELADTGRSDLIFAGRGGKPVGDFTVIRRALLEAARVDAGTLHDIRRTIVSALGDHGFDPQVADTLLNHAAATTMGGVMGVYQRSELWNKRREAIELWTRILMDAVGLKMNKPLCRETWGFDKPFADARIVRPERAKPADAPKKRRGRPPKRQAADAAA